jgi:hypothetical protein
MQSTTRRSTSTLPDTPAQVLAALRAEQDDRRASEVRSMRLAAHWVALHPAADSSDPEACFQSPKTLAGEGSPVIDEFCIPDVATMLGLTCDAVGSYLTDVVELRYRLPNLWAGVLAGEVTPWRARAIAQATVALTREAAAFVDEQTAWCANRVTPSQLVRLVDHARARFMPDALAKEIAEAADRRHVTFTTDQVSYDGTMHLEADLELPDALGLAEAVTAGAARLAALGSQDTVDGRRATALGDLARHQLAFGFPDDERRDEGSVGPAVEAGATSPVPNPQPPATRIVLHAHLSADAIARPDLAASTGECLTGSVEQAGGRVLSVEQIRAWCGRDDVSVVIKPVIDLHQRLETAGYTPTDRIREHVIARGPDVRVPVVWPQRETLRPGPRHPLRPSASRPRWADRDRQPRPAVSATSPPQDPRPVALPDDQPRRVRLDQPPRARVPPRPHRRPTYPAHGPPARPVATPPHTPQTERLRGHRRVNRLRHRDHAHFPTVSCAFGCNAGPLCDDMGV